MSDFQSAASRQGRAFQETVGVLLRIEGWAIIAEDWRHPDLGAEIDYVAVHPETGEEWWIECKGSWESERPGLERTDTTKKALWNGALLALAHERRPFMIIASHPPKDGSAGAVWLERALGIYVNAIRYVTFREVLE
jgi:hypothetical protein